MGANNGEQDCHKKNCHLWTIPKHVHIGAYCLQGPQGVQGTWHHSNLTSFLGVKYNPCISL